VEHTGCLQKEDGREDSRHSRAIEKRENWRAESKDDGPKVDLEENIEVQVAPPKKNINI